MCRTRSRLAAAAGTLLYGALLALPIGCGERPPDLLLITVDTLRADRLSTYGHRRRTSPTIDALAERGVVFERCYSAAGWTLPSVATLLTGHAPRTHGAVDFPDTLNGSLPTLASRLAARGYDTRAFVSHVLLRRRYGLDRGFEHFDASVLDVGHPHSVATGEALTDRALASLAELRRPWFLWVHYFDPHYDYLPHDGFDFGPTLLDRYDAEIAHTDRQIARLLEALHQRGLDENAIVVFASDHGEEFGEHGGYEHYSLNEPVMRVPLIVSAPGLAPARIREPVQQADLVPTLLALMDAGGADPPLQGADLLGDLDPDRPIFFERDRPVQYHQRGVVRGRYKLTVVTPARLDDYPRDVYQEPAGVIAHVTPGIALYDLARDPREKRNLYTATHPEGRALLALLTDHYGVVESWARSGEAGGQLDPRLEGQLRSLGYLE